MPINAVVGSLSANSYVTLDEAETYFGDRVHASMWTAFSQKEEALITSSQMLDWYFRWKGIKVVDAQSMKWPRMGAVRRDGSLVDDTIIPPEVKVAVYELALSSILSDRTADFALFGIGQVKAGSLMVKASANTPSTSKETIPEKVSKILSDLYVRGGFGVIRLMRA